MLVEKLLKSFKINCDNFFQDITCDKSVIVLNGDDILLGDCDTVAHVENNEVIWRDDQVGVISSHNKFSEYSRKCRAVE